MMNSLFGRACALALISLSFLSPAMGQDPLVETQALIRQTISAAAISRGARVAADAAPIVATADFCVSRRTYGPEGMPHFQSFACSDGVKIDAMRRWCWTSRCSQELLDDSVKMMTGKGYELIGAFHFGRTTEKWTGHQLFQKAKLSTKGLDQYCLAQRNFDGRHTSYMIDCGDGAVTNISLAEGEKGIGLITEYFAKRGYEPLGQFEIQRSYRPVLFRKKTNS